MTYQHFRRLGATPPLELGIELFDMPHTAVPRISPESIRAKLQRGCAGELTPEERGFLQALLEEHAPASRRGAA